MELIDLSIAIDARTPYYPGDPVPRVCPATTIAGEGYAVSRLDLGSHTGTHCDAPSHFLADGLTLDELPLERFVGPAVYVDATGLGPRGRITWEAFVPTEPALRPGAIVLLHTGWDARLHEDDYFDHPFLDGDACEALVARGVRTVGIDAINLDETPREHFDRATFRCHHALSSAGGVIVENLTNLGALRGRDGATVSVLPLKVPGCDGAPTRAVAMVGGER